MCVQTGLWLESQIAMGKHRRAGRHSLLERRGVLAILLAKGRGVA
jgi:hypothetical protein